MANKKKMVDDIAMSFEDNTPVMAAATAEDIKKEDEVLEYKGKTVATRNEKGEIIVFDTEGSQIPSEVLQTLYNKYQPAPEFDSQDYEQSGKLKVRFTKEVPDEVKLPDGRVVRSRKTIDCDEDECEMISEIQEYKSGQILNRSMLAKFFPAIKFLRGEIDFKEKKEK